MAEAIGRARRPRPRSPTPTSRGQLYAVVVRDGRCTLHDLGVGGRARRAPRGVRLRPAPAEPGAGLGGVAGRGRRAARRRRRRRSPASCCRATVARSDRPLVVVPTGVLHGVPWGALAAAARPAGVGEPVAERVVGGGRRAAGRRPGGRRPRSSPGRALRLADAEVVALAGELRAAPSSCPPAASSAEGTIELFGASELVHLACHGSFRRDNPLFSTLALADGPLTVYDLERAAAMPEVVVLSACSVGTSAAINGGHAARAVERARGVRRVGRDRPADPGQRRARARPSCSASTPAWPPASTAGRGAGRGDRAPTAPLDPIGRRVRRDRRLSHRRSEVLTDGITAGARRAPRQS